MRIKKYFLLILMSIIFSSCAGGENVAIKVGGNTITIESFNKELDYMNNIMNKGNKAVDYLSEVKKNLVYDSVVSLDLAKHMNSVSKEEVDDYVRELSEKLGSEEDLQRSLEANKISRKEFMDSCEKAKAQLKHYEIFASSVQMTADDLKKYFDSHKEDIYQYKFVDIVLQTRGEAEGVEKELKSDTDKEQIINRYNQDLFDTTYGKITDFVNSSSADFITDKIKGMKVGETKIVRIDRDYHILQILEKNTDFEALKDSVKKMYIDEKYLKYINKLCVDYKVRVYDKNIEKNRQKKD